MTKRPMILNVDLINSFPVNKFFNVQDCFIGDEPINMTEVNFRKRVKAIDPNITTRPIKIPKGIATEFKLTKTRKEQLLKIFTAKAIQNSSLAYVIEDANGDRFTITNMNKFCKENKLSKTMLTGNSKRCGGFKLVKRLERGVEVKTPLEGLEAKERELFDLVMKA